MTDFSEKIRKIKGDKSFQELAQDIFDKTGVRIHFTTLQKYTQGERQPSKRTLRALSSYSGKPISWFFGEDNYTSCGYKGDKNKIQGYEDILLEAKEKHIPYEAFELFIKAVEVASKNRE